MPEQTKEDHDLYEAMCKITAQHAEQMTDWEKNFCREHLKRYKKFGDSAWGFSDKQFDRVVKILNKLGLLPESVEAPKHPDFDDWECPW